MAAKRIQWHPLFTRLLRPHVEGYYEVRTQVAVGDVPREAELVLLRRKRTVAPPLQGLWKWLTPWNLLEYKGRSSPARTEHVPRLVELGLGIARRLNEEARQERRATCLPGGISFWYLANRLGATFHREAGRMLAGLESLGEGLWRCYLLDHPVLLVSAAELPVDEDSLALHVLAEEPDAKERQVWIYLTQHTARVESYGATFATFHPAIWKEMRVMGRKTAAIDFRPLI